MLRWRYLLVLTDAEQRDRPVVTQSRAGASSRAVRFLPSTTNQPDRSALWPPRLDCGHARVTSGAVRRPGDLRRSAEAPGSGSARAGAGAARGRAAHEDVTVTRRLTEAGHDGALIGSRLPQGVLFVSGHRVQRTVEWPPR